MTTIPTALLIIAGLIVLVLLVTRWKKSKAKRDNLAAKAAERENWD